MAHTMPLHLTVIQPTTDPNVPATNCHALVDPVRQDVRWNQDYSAWSVRDRNWWDDASYIAYQSGDDTDDSADDGYQYGTGMTNGLPRKSYSRPPL